MSQPEQNLPEEENPTADITCETCRMPLIPHDSNNNTVPGEADLSNQNAEGSDDIVFIENLQMMTGSLEKGINRSQVPDYMARRHIIRPLFSKSSDLGRLNAETLGLMTDSPKVDHPVCRDCTDNILHYVMQDIKSDEDDIEQYEKLLQQLEMEDKGGDIDELTEAFQKLKDESALLEVEFSQLLAEKDEIDEIIRCLRKDCYIIEKETNKMFLRYPGPEFLQLQDSSFSVDNLLTYVKNRLDKLAKAQVFRDTFRISCDGSIGKINGYRLGRLKDIPVSWAEINLAWGQSVLLLHSLSKLTNFNVENFELVPIFNRSYVKFTQGKDTKLLPLFYFGEGNKRIKQIEFDQAMVGFLNCFQKLQEVIEKEGTIRLPYPIRNSKIIDLRIGRAYSVKLQLNTEENWTRALKFVLTNLRWAIVWSSKKMGE